MKAKLCFAVAVIFCMTAADAFGDIIPIAARGNWNGLGSSNNASGAGNARAYETWNSTSPGLARHSYFAFNTSEWAGKHVISGTLRLRANATGTLGANLALWDFTGDTNALTTATAGGAAIYADLAGGVQYGTFNNIPANQDLVITLNAAAINDLRNASGLFVIGGALTNGGTATAFNGTAGAGNLTQLDLVLQDNLAPVSDPGGPYTINYLEDLMLDGSGSFDPDESLGDSIISWLWDVNGDNVFDFAGETLTVTWNDLIAVGVMPGNVYNLQLQTTDEMGATHVAQTTFTVNAVPEPATCLIFALAGGSCGLVTLRRRRKGQAAA